jgi:hypothetical protein
MSAEQVLKRYPLLCAIAAHPKLQEDLGKAESAAKIDDGKGLWAAYKAGEFVANELTYALCLHEFGEIADGVADEIEENLAKIVAAVGEQKAREAYRDKLLVNGIKPFIDVRYEIGAAAGASLWFDKGTMQLEAKLPGSQKNSDLAGKRNGVDVRLEVRVVHDDWPAGIDATAEQTIKNANVPMGFTAQLRFLPDTTAATRIKHLIEELHRVANAGSMEFGTEVVVDDVTFHAELMGSGFSTQDEKIALSEVTFEGDQADRLIVPPVFIRATIDPQEYEWIKNPEGVHVFSGEMADQRTYENKPFSSKIGEAVARKVRQCAEGACNIVVLGTPSPMVDHDVSDAAQGAMAITYIKATDGSFTSAGPVRKPSAMFVPAAQSENVDNLVDPYRKISGVWHIRLGRSNPESRIFSNPNAAVPIGSADADTLAATLPHS